MTRWLSEPPCHICGRTRTQCQEARIFEEANRVPDPHDFETLEDAERNRTRPVELRKPA